MSRYISCETVFKLSNESFTVDVAGGVIEGKASRKQSVGEKSFAATLIYPNLFVFLPSHPEDVIPIDLEKGKPHSSSILFRSRSTTALVHPKPMTFSL
jgi:hypothetical protein